MPHGKYSFLVKLSRFAYVNSTRTYESYLSELRGGINTIEREPLLVSLPVRLLCIEAIVRIDPVGERVTDTEIRIGNSDWLIDGLPICIKPDINNYEKQIK